ANGPPSAAASTRITPRPTGVLDGGPLRLTCPGPHAHHATEPGPSTSAPPSVARTGASDAARPTTHPPPGRSTPSVLPAVRTLDPMLVKPRASQGASVASSAAWTARVRETSRHAMNTATPARTAPHAS